MDEEPKLLRAKAWAMSWCVDCPHCHETLLDIDNYLGREYQCDECGKEFIIDEPR